MHLRLTLDVPRSVNHLYRNGTVTRGKTKVVGRFLTDEGRQSKEDIGWKVRQAVVEQQLDIDPTAYYGYRVAIHFADAGRDLDNTFKVLQDGIFEALGINDSRVLRIEASKLVDKLHPRVEVEIYETTIADIAAAYRTFKEGFYVPAMS